ncbi:Oidioi.mRNA.OKI2018_I69.XSR.g13446.t2.cds [Oikopleura dioica]|uniref:Oidioi.mRNA.OKI2018_I69.XSR.g13446.t2.cds n=1 Tax=Oikopleura dioica TaxID=34765 RepID=A0ABN7S6X0_OIKDI|nr:Oidioi.mRNA.OKI2018_I69.XSR.g13446.t2.cds [Oikopleura dioica]
MSMNWQFKADHPLEQRMAESSKIRSKYPDRIPVIVQKVETSNIERIDKRKYLVPSDITAAQFMWIIRKRINLDAERAIFLFVDKMVPQSRFVQSSVEQCDSDSDSQNSDSCESQSGKVRVAFTWTMGELYQQHKDEDGFLYVAYSGENTFGSC